MNHSLEEKITRSTAKYASRKTWTERDAVNARRCMAFLTQRLLFAVQPKQVIDPNISGWHNGSDYDRREHPAHIAISVVQKERKHALTVFYQLYHSRRLQITVWNGQKFKILTTELRAVRFIFGRPS